MLVLSWFAQPELQMSPAQETQPFFYLQHWAAQTTPFLTLQKRQEEIWWAATTKREA